MPTYYDSRNQPHLLSERLGSGGEGTVYVCEDYKLVGKIYYEPISEEKAEKLRWMAANKNERLLKVAAWVIDVLHDSPGGEVVGFLMPNVTAKEIHELYSLKSRRVYFPEATWHFLVHTATNVARAFYNLHQNNHIMGDVNHGNCVVMRDGTVKLIDCDSYSIKTEKLRYPCEVGVATHLAPELQGANLRDIERENKHDNFGLAVIIFQLLFLGRHPFAGNYLGGEDKSLEDCIREYRFAYGTNAELKNVRQPPGTLSLSAVSPRVALMFERAFLTEKRPEAREWIEALEDLSLNLDQCSLHPGHLYFKELDACPWCEIEAQTGLMLFPFITSGAHLNGEKPFNIFTVENLIASFGIENNFPAKTLPVLQSQQVFPPSREIIDARKDNRNIIFFIVPAYLFALIFAVWVFGIGWAVYLGVLLMFVLNSFLYNSNVSIRQPLEETLADYQQKWEKAEKQQMGAGVPQIINDDLVKIRKKVADYQSVQLKSVNEIKRIHSETASRELYKYLHSKSIANARISGIDKSQQKNLIAAGVKTAAEINESRLKHFYKIDDEIIPPLLEWRQQIVGDFQTSEQASEAIKGEQTRFINEINGERRQIERDIEQLLILLRFGALNLRKQQQEFFTKAEELAKQISQTKSDLRAIGSNMLAMVLIALISIFTPIFASFTSLNTSADVPPLSRDRQANIIHGSNSPRPSGNFSVSSGAYLPDENITATEINALSDAHRARYAENLYNEAITYSYVNIDYAKAQQFCRRALRFSPDDTRILNTLGYALYEQGEYDESLFYLKNSLELEESNIQTKIFISMDYLASSRYKDAANILNEVTTEYPGSFEGFFNLGLAYNGLKNYAKAETAFRRAAEINPSDVDTHYELGVCLYKLKEWDKFTNEYNSLLKLDKNRAERLLKDTKFEIKSRDNNQVTISR